ncbi:hypothetical protein WN51_07444 [Melipona quadrifasciata]|uniref:Uncharacterized protein n=1 Tax=Melipona quadrifasciata TaxID=166423 RepID=A0A0M9A9B5_9HYME|nr:hypothetical protein WN51_07444 [Melipona quadrifasciata]
MQRKNIESHFNYFDGFNIDHREDLRKISVENNFSNYTKFSVSFKVKCFGMNSPSNKVTRSLRVPRLPRVSIKSGKSKSDWHRAFQDKERNLRMELFNVAKPRVKRNVVHLDL